MAVPVKADIEAVTATVAARLSNSVRRRLDAAATDLRAAVRGLGTPEEILSAPRQNLDNLSGRLSTSLLLAARSKRADLRATAARLTPDIIGRRIRRDSERTVYAYSRMGRALGNISERKSTRLSNAAGRLNWRRLDRVVVTARSRFDQCWRLVRGLNHERVLERGFALVRNAEGVAVTSATGLKPGNQFSVQFHDGSVDAVACTDGGSSSGSKKSPEKRSGSSRSVQGKLF
jgi:exodeoxyribonuclease VII large subunit